MALARLFANKAALVAPRADAVNHEGGAAYAYAPEERLAQLAMTGTLGDGAYAAAEAQLVDLLDAARGCDPLFVARAAVHARKAGAMKDAPALLTAYLTVAEPDLAVRVFGRTIDNARMLRSFVQILRSGQVGRRSLGTRPRWLVRQWLEQASTGQLLRAATGTAPSLADIVRMVHPAPATPERRAFYGWLIGKPYDQAALPPEIAGFEAWKRDPARPLPHVPFEWLTAHPLTREQWGTIALERMGWQALRMNLNTLARQGAFDVPGVVQGVAARLADADAIASARVLPYQLMVAMNEVGEGVPLAVQAALEQALEVALGHVPVLAGQLVVCPDVSGSMHWPVTGWRKGATSKVRCIDVAALVSAALLRANRKARVLPFAETVKPVWLRSGARLAVNTAKLAAQGGGGTNVSAPLARLNRHGARVDTVVIVSDNQSWLDPARHGASATMAEWARLKARNPAARLICIDIAPYGTSPVQSGADILNIGGFTDAVFDTMARFAQGQARSRVEIIDEVEI
ncbi:RNA-binding protein [Novosphingobium sp. 1949]|uniref:RNA-binding protein n=1 Tax=Novosphingobium organovorum TaxID=2930092 RepID=A0ABT0BGU7_9SPHN|nr:RNA-binding protein [Novosphingobium organovorum]MCJ2184193.1 RNA-binding protein [Novosphingobium organovorum]